MQLNKNLVYSTDSSPTVNQRIVLRIASYVMLSHNIFCSILTLGMLPV